MPKKVVPLITGETYHIFNRGVDKRTIFSDKADFFRFHKSLQLFNSKKRSGSIFEQRYKTDWIADQAPLVKIHAYCLLKNHYHLLLTQAADGGISEFMKRLSGGYTNYFNERWERSGVLFQGSFKRVHVDSNEQLLYLASYVNLNNLVHGKQGYFLSSMDNYRGERNEHFVDMKIILKQYKNRDSFLSEAKKTVLAIKAKRASDKKYNIKNLLE